MEQFLNEFLPSREEAADEYEFPQYADSPEVTFRSADEALDKCIAEQGTDYGIYWRALGNAKPEHAMLFFLEDGHVIYGLSTDDSYPEYATELLNKMKSFLNSSLGYIGHEASPDVSNIDEFKVQINVHKP